MNIYINSILYNEKSISIYNINQDLYIQNKKIYYANNNYINLFCILNKKENKKSLLYNNYKIEFLIEKYYINNEISTSITTFNELELYKTIRAIKDFIWGINYINYNKRYPRVSNSSMKNDKRYVFEYLIKFNKRYVMNNTIDLSYIKFQLSDYDKEIMFNNFPANTYNQNSIYNYTSDQIQSYINNNLSNIHIIISVYSKEFINNINPLYIFTITLDKLINIIDIIDSYILDREYIQDKNNIYRKISSEAAYENYLYKL